MEDLFRTSLQLEAATVQYQVIFDQEQYVFIAEGNAAGYDRFAIKREHDRWIEQQPLPAQLSAQATRALEEYLLQQH